MTDVQPGAFAVVNAGTRATPLIQFGELLCTIFDPNPQEIEWDHVVICSRICDDGTIYIIEAQPGGEVEVPWHYEQHPHQWSTCPRRPARRHSSTSGSGTASSTTRR